MSRQTVQHSSHHKNLPCRQTPENSHSRIYSLEMICNRSEVKGASEVGFYLRPVSASMYCRWPRLCIRVLSVCLSVYQSRVCPCDHLSPFKLASLNLGQNYKEHCSIISAAICNVPKLCNNILHLLKYYLIINMPAGACVAETDVSKLALCIRHASPCICTTV